jgi:hypothetical protein
VAVSVTGTLNVTSCASALSRSTSRPPTNIDTVNEQVAKLEFSCLAAWQIRIAGGGATRSDIARHRLNCMSRYTAESNTAGCPVNHCILHQMNQCPAAFCGPRRPFTGGSRRCTGWLISSGTRQYQTDVKLFLDYATDPAYDWNEHCGRLFGTVFAQVITEFNITEFNRAKHVQANDARSLKRPFTLVELQQFFDLADLEPERILNAGRKGALAPPRATGGREKPPNAVVCVEP